MRRFTVQALTAELERLLARSFPRVVVEGELSQVSTPNSGHAYLTLRDGTASLQCVVWRADWAALPTRPRVGQRVACHGRLGLYAGQGRYQLYANRVEKRLRAIRERLQADGLIDPRRRRPLPAFPAVVGVATSTAGAALQDFLRVSAGRYPAARVLVAGCTVQGPEAASSVVRALELLFEDGRADVIVVTRGGGSRLDLMPFHDEQLARWIATSPVPVVSAVGHEIDTTIADLVADAVAPTPSAAAVLVLPDGLALAQRIDEVDLRLRSRVQGLLDARRRRVTELSGRLRHPARALAERRRRSDELLERLTQAAARATSARRQRLVALGDRLRALSPYGVLERGYAIVHGPRGVVRGVGDVSTGDPVAIRVANGVIAGRVEDPDAVDSSATGGRP
jgi:exodeoxyribonuclease VII large subunit